MTDVRHVVQTVAGACLLPGILLAREVNVPEGEAQTLSDSLSGAEELVKTGPGTLTLGGANAGWTGAIDVQGGTLEAPVSALGATGDLRVREGATLRVTGKVPKTRQTRRLYLSGTVDVAGTSGDADWLFADATLEGDATLAGGMVGFTDGTLELAGHTLTLPSGGAYAWFTREVLSGPGVIAKSGGYVGFYRYSGDFGAGVTVRIATGATCLVQNCRNARAMPELRSYASGGKCNWLMAKSTANPDTDNVWAGPVVLETGELQMYADNVANDRMVVEGPISGDGWLASSPQAGSSFTLRGAANTFRNGLAARSGSWNLVGAQTVPPQGLAAYRAYIYGSGDLRLVGWTQEEAGALLASCVLKDNPSGRVVLVPGESGEMAYAGPFAATLAHKGDGTISTATNAITDALVANICAANLAGDWNVGGDPAAVSELANMWYDGGRLTFKDAGTLLWHGSGAWIASRPMTTDNVAAPRLRFEGETSVAVGTGTATRPWDSTRDTGETTASASWRWRPARR